MSTAESAVTRLDNGLRVVSSERPGTGAVSISVAYGVGYRDERPGQTGFAHLFEHLMGQGSVNLRRLEYKSLIEGSGGSYGASTRGDHTLYNCLVPATDTELALWCEADRMRGLRLTEDVLANEVAVVEQEIRGFILSRPYGAFPWFPVDANLFTRFANSHDGYGEFADLERANLDDVYAFFYDYYAPGNATVAVVGDIEPEHALDLVSRYFAELPPRSVPPGRDWDEPPPTGDRRAQINDRLAPSPALAIGWRVPDPSRQVEAYLRFKLLDRVLTGGPQSWWWRQLVDDDGLARSVIGWMGSAGSWAGTRHPAQYATGFHPASGVGLDRLLAGIDHSTADLVEHLDDSSVHRAAVWSTTTFHRSLEASPNRASYLAVCHLLFGTPTFGDPIGVWSNTTSDHLRDLARQWLVDAGRAVVEIVPAGEQV